MSQLSSALHAVAKYSRGWKWECALSLVAGLMSVACAVKIGGDKNDMYYRALVIGEKGYDILRSGGWVLVFLGVLLLFFVSRHLVRSLKLSTTIVLGILIFLMISHFLVALIFTEYKNTTVSALRTSLLDQLRVIKLSQMQFTATYHLNDLWDLLQINMKCCGVDSYKDYGSDTKFVPHSCCVLKEDSVIPQPDSLAQCLHDVKLGVVSSAFLHTKGCHESLLSWFMRYTAGVSEVLFMSISLQVLSILYLTWRHLSSAPSTKSALS